MNMLALHDIQSLFISQRLNIGSGIVVFRHAVTVAAFRHAVAVNFLPRLALTTLAKLLDAFWRLSFPQRQLCSRLLQACLHFLQT